ncbi:enoyl-CoA hydratase/isomerase family protein [Chloroflexota bacterium]
MESFANIIYEKKGNVAWITLNRPDARNALNDPTRAELMTALSDARDDQKICVIVITGAGDKAFCAGADISEFPKLNPKDQIARHARPNPVPFIRQLPKPVIAMVNGLALGGGCEIVLACDIAIASENAQFGQPEIRVGIIPGSGGTQVLPRLIGEKRAKELIYTGSMITSEEALRYGLVNKVVPPEQLQETTETFVNQVLRQSPVILQFAKLAVNRAMETTLPTGLASERDLFALCFSTKDQKEGATAFLEKRKPEYKGE